MREHFQNFREPPLKDSILHYEKRGIALGDLEISLADGWLG
ncbi:MAG TPA: hypothetical protein VEI80_02735 [Candidatus Acidoferrales bacterium]|nr:hypothetical protein [Candidatus Acidoferrales bacterium]